MNIKQRSGVLRNRWQAANKLYTKSDDPDDYERAGRELYGLLRESWERGVSEVLLNDVVERDRPSIETKKVAPLSRHHGSRLQGGRRWHDGMFSLDQDTMARSPTAVRFPSLTS